MNHVCFSLNILLANLNFLCDLKILSKVVSKRVKFDEILYHIKKIVLCMGNIDTRDKGKENEPQVKQFIETQAFK